MRLETIAHDMKQPGGVCAKFGTRYTAMQFASNLIWSLRDSRSEDVSGKNSHTMVSTAARVDIGAI